MRLFVVGICDVKCRCKRITLKLLAVIIQQIYARFRQGHTQDQRFARLGTVVQGYAHLAELALAQGRISGLRTK